MNQLYSRCPSCKSIYSISLEAVRIGRGQALCQKCQKPFSLLESLAASAPDTKKPLPDYNLVVLANPIGKQNEKLHFTDWDSADKNNHSWQYKARWTIASLAAMLLLLSQLWFNQKQYLLSLEQVYPVMSQFCKLVGCEIPPYHNPDKFEILDRALTMQNDQPLLFAIAFANNASQPQSLPPIQLTLLALTGHPVAQRIFQPAEYLDNHSPDDLLPPQQQLRLELELAHPDVEFGGYEIRFL